MLGEVLRTERRRRPLRHGPAVEHLDPFKRLRQLRLNEGPVREEDALHIGIAFKEPRHRLRDAHEPRRSRAALARIADGRRRQLPQRARAKALEECQPTCDGAGDSGRRDARAGNRIAFQFRRCGQVAAGVEACQLAFLPDHREEVPAQPTHVRVNDGEHEVHGHSGICRIPAR